MVPHPMAAVSKMLHAALKFLGTRFGNDEDINLPKNIMIAAPVTKIIPFTVPLNADCITAYEAINMGDIIVKNLR